MNKNLVHPPVLPRRASAVGAAGVLVVGLMAAGAPTAKAGTANAADIYEMSVVSSGLAINIHDPNLVLQPDVSVGPYAATASLNSLGASSAQAGAPFLGDYVGPLVGHFNGLGAGEIPPFPPVPGEVRSSYPGQPSAIQRNGGYSIEATSDEYESTANVGLGAAAPGSENATLFSLAHTLADGKGGLKAVGSAGVDLLNVGGVLDIGRVSSLITMTQTGLGEPKFATNTDVGTVTVSGQKFGLDQNGLTAAGSNSGVSTTQVNEATKALEAAGISIRYVPAAVTYVPGTKTVQSIQSGAVEVAYAQEVPSQGLVTSTYTLGYVQVSATAQSFGVVADSQPAGTATNSTAMKANGAGGVTDMMRLAATEPSTNGTGLVVSGPALGGVSRLFAHGAASEEPSAAVITPTLRMMRFGSVLGLPDGCNIVVGTLGAGANEIGAGNDAGATLSSAVDGCTALGNAGGEQLTAAMGQSAQLAAINPAVNPGIDSFADAMESVGRDQAAAVAPFGPTMVGLANSARFFKGCETC